MERYNYLVQNKRGTYLYIYIIYLHIVNIQYIQRNVFLKFNYFFLRKDRLQYLETSKGS